MLMLTAHQRELIKEFDAEDVAEVFKVMGWSWFGLGRGPTPSEIRSRLADLIQSAELLAFRDPSKQAQVGTGRLEVTADLTAEPFYTLSFVPVSASSDEVAAYCPIGKGDCF